MNVPCPICKRDGAKQSKDFHTGIHLIKCDVCGKYQLDDDLYIQSEKNSVTYGMEDKYKDKGYILSGVTRNDYEKEKVTKITIENRAGLIDSAPIHETPLEIIDLILQYLCFRPFFSEKKIDIDTDYSRFYAKDKYELLNVLDETERLDYLSHFRENYKLTTKGWERADQLRRKLPDSKKAFVAMWFNKDLEVAYSKGIYPALYETGYDPYRVDLDKKNRDMIDNKIIAEIRKSILLIIDLTGARPSVLFEAGLAMGLGIEIIWTSRKDNETKIPFDVRQFRRIIWETPEKLKEELIDTIEARDLRIGSSR